MDRWGRFKGGGAPWTPSEAMRKGEEGGTNLAINCQNSLQKRLKYIKITLKVDFYERKKMALAPIAFFRRGDSGVARTFSRANSPKHRFYVAVVELDRLKINGKIVCSVHI